LLWESKSSEIFTILHHKGITEIGCKLKDGVRKSVWADSSQARLDRLIQSLIQKVFFTSNSNSEAPSIMLGTIPSWRRS